MKTKVFGVLVLLLATFSCVKENEQEMQPVDGGEERFAEFDPVVRFGLDTYMGGADDSEPLTKTTYAGDDKTIVLDNVRYERINWNWDPSAAGPENKVDTVRIWSKDVFTKNNKLFADYSPWYIPGVTNVSGIKDSAADAKILSTDEKDNFYWEMSKDPRYFFSVYPTPTDRTSLSVTDPTGTPLEVTVSGIIPRNQKYLKKKVDGNVAGYVKVPLRFKPLFSAVKLKVTAADAGAQNYRLKKVELRTDLFYDDLHQSDPERVNQPKYGTPLNGDFTAKFGTVPSGDDKKPEYTGDFTVTDYTGKDPATRDTTNKRLTIRIEETDRVWLGDKEVNVTFLALPIQQEVMTIVYTFEVNDGDGNPKTDDEGNIIEVTRYLALQQKTTKTDNTGEHNEFQERGWFPLPKATKLYVKSNVPEIQYYFDVVIQGDLPRTWKAGSTKPLPKTGETFLEKDFFEAKDFYAVISYRDSSGFKQPLRWKVTGYRPEGESSFYPTKPASVSWLNLRGDGPWKKHIPFDVDDSKHPGYPYTDTGYSFDPWVVVQGQGTKMKDPVDKDGNTVSEDSEDLVGYRNFDTGFYNFYDAGAPDNGTRSWGWVNHGSYIHSTPDGEFVHHENDGVAFLNSTGWKGENGEAYAFDLSSHDIYGVLYSGLKNGDLGTTANCYVVSSPGWYRFPAVYGNAIKGGNKNEKAYKGLGTGDNHLMGWYKDYKAADIKEPWIPYPIKSVSVVWQDAISFVSERNDADTRMDRRPFCETIDGKQYIYFYVDDIAQGNAVVAAKDGEGKIVWSWHIWAVTDPVNSLKTVELKSNETGLDPYQPLTDDRPTSPTAEPGFNILPSPYNFTSYPTNDETKRPMQWPFTKKSSVKNVFWKEADLGQNGKEPTEVGERYCDVEFTQYFKGKVVRKVVRRFLQSGVKDTRSDTPGYQWGRKDPMQEGFVTVKPLPTDVTKEHADATILEPTSFYYGSNANVPTGKVYDNLWNNNIDVALTDSRCDDERNQFPGGSKDRNVEKTIYDPSPAGYVVPNMYAFSAFNPYGTIVQIRFPSAKVDEIAYKADETYKTDGTGYIDFYAGYNKDADYKRKKDKDYTIRIFFTGRINGTSSAGTVANRENVYLWTSEPAFYGGYHGRSFCTQNSFGTASWGLNPVTGLSGAEPKDPSNPSAGNEPGIRRDGASQPKWQRSHCNRVRPMVEQP